MTDFTACKRGFQIATGVFAQAVLAQSVILCTVFIVGAVIL
ncbi:MAG: hypothetical protein AAFN79_08720 [Pseudomonadota bacterium]